MIYYDKFDYNGYKPLNLLKGDFMNYCMQYLKTENVNLVKDMGMIPYKLYELYGFNSWVSTFENGKYPYLEKEVKGLKIDFVKRYFNNYTLDGTIHLWKNSKNIDILQIFHVTLSSVVYAYMYKFRNKKGKLYLKLDCSYKLPERINSLNAVGKSILKKFFNKIDLISVEQEKLYDDLIEAAPYLKEKLVNIPNGLDFKYMKTIDVNYDYDKKENIILTVARIGAEEKRIDMLLEAFASIDNVESLGWKLHLVGPIEEGFKKNIEEFYCKHPALKDLVVFKGNIENREELYKEYAKAKIFTLTSEFESFAFVFIEAAALGDVIVSTDVGIARELIDGDNGKVVDINDRDGFKDALIKYMTQSDLKECSEKTRNLCLEKFDWDNIIKKLHGYLSRL